MNLTYAIVEEVADRRETDPISLPPLYETIDPETLENLLESSSVDSTVVAFTYYGCSVRVTGNGEIHVANTVEQ